MMWKRLAVVLVSVAVGISVPIGLIGAPAKNSTPIARADGVAYTGAIGTCTWTLSADRTTLTIDGGSDGTLPEGETGGVRDSIIRYNIIQQIRKNHPTERIYFDNLESLNLKGNIKTGKNASYLFAGFSAYDNQRISLNGLENLDTSNATDISGMFNNADAFENLDLSHFNTENVTDMSKMFVDCQSLHTLDLSSFNTKNVTDMNNMFTGLTGLTQEGSLVLGDNFDTHNVTNMSQMFLAVGLPELDLTKLDTSNVTEMDGMFERMNNLEKIDVSNLNTAKVTSMNSMFEGEDSLENIKFGGDFDTSNVQYMSRMFYGLKKISNLNLSQFNTSSVTNMHSMFDQATGIVTLDLSSFDTGKVNDFSSMFDGDSNLQNVDVSSFQTGNGTAFNQMFQSCTSLKQLDLSNFDTKKAVKDPEDKNDTTYGVAYMFYNDPNLQSLDISNFTMTYDKVNGLYTYSEDIFGGDNQLSRLALGPNVHFITDQSVEGLYDGPALANITPSEQYTGKWEAVGTGTESDPKGKVYQSSDDLVAAYGITGQPTGKQIYVWEPVKRPVTPSVPSLPATETPTVGEPDEVFRGSSVSAIKKIGLYRQPTFAKRNRITWYAKAPRTRQPQLVVTGKAVSKNGVPRYQVRDVNRHSKTYRLRGFITTRAAYVTPTYLTEAKNDSRITVINPQGINGYSQANLTQKRKHYRQGQQLKVKRIVTHNLTTRFQLMNGEYVTANRQWVQNGPRSYPRSITTKHTIWRYRDVNFGKAIHHYRRHQQLKIRGWDYSDHGTLRYRVAGGYVTANKLLVK